MRYAPRALLAGGLGFAVSVLAACGGGGAGLLSSDQANNLNAALDSISNAVQAHNCGAASRAAAALNTEVSNLPSSINATLQSNLDQGASVVQRLANQDCNQPQQTTTTTTTTPKPKTTTTTTSSTSTTSTTTSTSTSSTTPTTSTTTPATTTSSSGTTSTGTSGGAGLGGTSGGSGSGGAGPTNGIGSGQ